MISSHKTISSHLNSSFNTLNCILIIGPRCTVCVCPHILCVSIAYECNHCKCVVFHSQYLLDPCMAHVFHYFSTTFRYSSCFCPRGYTFRPGGVHWTASTAHLYCRWSSTPNLLVVQGPPPHLLFLLGLCGRCIRKAAHWNH